MNLRTCRLLSALSVLAAAGAVAWAAEAAPRVVRLDELNLANITQGWGEPQRDRSMREKPMSIAGQAFEHGVGTHAVSKLLIALDGGSERFTASVGLDDGAGSPKGSIIFRVEADGKRLFDSGVMHQGDATRKVDVDVHGVKQLQLLVDDAGDGVQFDHADWAGAQFTVSGARTLPHPEPPQEPAVRLTPPPAATPRINGASVFGVRPGSPFLFTIAATGDRPMTFAAASLPDGLKLDTSTGQITGAIAKAGEYTVQLTASNARGDAGESFRIVCGEHLALTPHMGWNHWYTWLGGVRDEQIRQAADAMVNTGMINFGYQYINIDDGWAVRANSKDAKRLGPHRDADGNVLPNGYFPDMAGLAAYIHSKGLKAGLYSSPGPLTCDQCEGSYQHEEQDVRRYVAWGFDFLKYDWCSYGRIEPKPDLAGFVKPYRLIGDILKKQPRDIVLNLCQYGRGNVWEWGREIGGNSWRTADDLGRNYAALGETVFSEVFDLYTAKELHKYGGPGAWNDPDYLLLGYVHRKGQVGPTSLTPNEQYTQVSLWSIIAAPLIFSGDMNRLDDFTLGLLCNAEVIDVDQDPLGKPGRRFSKDGHLEVWSRDLADGSKAVGLFNRGETETTVTARFSDLDLIGKHSVRDLWRQKDLGTFADQFSATVGRHGVVLVRVLPAQP